MHLRVKRKTVVFIALLGWVFLFMPAFAAVGSEKPLQKQAGEVAACAESLAKARFSFPAEAADFWQKSDGLPTPDDPRFAEKAAAQLAADREGPLWRLPETASRQCKCLAYLADGRAEGRSDVARLCVEQARCLLRDLPVRRAGHGAVDRVFCAAAASLAFTGAVVQRESPVGSLSHAVASQWLFTGAGQFATNMEKSKGKEREIVQGVLAAAGVDASKLSLQLSDADFFAALDLTRPDMKTVAAGVAAGDYEAAKRAYAEALAERFSARNGWPDVNFSKTTDLAEADDICRNVFILQAHMFRRMDFGQEVDWTRVIDKDVESRVWMNAHPWMWTLVNAYRDTHDDKYVKHLCRLFLSWYNTSPVTFQRTDAQWRTLEAGNRVGQKWTAVLLALSGHPQFKRECLYFMARSMYDHGRYLSTYAASGGNWLQVESSGLACVALLFPEFKLSPTFYGVAMRRLAQVNEHAFLPDGFQAECSPGYHYFPLMGMAGALRLANYLGQPVPASFMRQYEKAVEAVQWISYPDRTLPMLSDFNPGRPSAVEGFQTGAEVFRRKDFQWLGSDGRQGQPPSETSHDFTHAGYCVMRDKWGHDGQVLIFDAGYFGAGHQHEDKLNFVLYAGGRELIGDPGIYSYKGDEFEPYWRGSWSHNTVTVDGLSQLRARGPAETIPDPDRRFVQGKGFDFAEGWYRHAYALRGAQVWKSDQNTNTAHRVSVLKDVHHQRCVFYVKGRYAVVCDRMVGTGEHQLDILFHPAPVISGSGLHPTIRPVALTVRDDRSVLTVEKAAANVAILPAQGSDFEVLDLIGQKDPVRGWFAVCGIQPSHDIVYRWRGQLPRHFETVIQPLLGDKDKPMVVEARPVTCRGSQTCAAVVCGSDLFLLSYDGPAAMECGGIRFQGTALLLERDQQGRVLQAFAVEGRELRVGGRDVPVGDFDLR